MQQMHFLLLRPLRRGRNRRFYLKYTFLNFAERVFFRTFLTNFNLRRVKLDIQRNYVNTTPFPISLPILQPLLTLYLHPPAPPLHFKIKVNIFVLKYFLGISGRVEKLAD